MKNIIAIALVAGAASLVRAGDGLPTPAKQAGRVLILQNERTITGDVELIGTQYRIKRLIGETWIPADGVLKLCASLDDAYEYMKGRANLHDPDERLRLGDWCRQHGLREQAVTEIRAAAELRPKDERIQRLLAHVKESKARAQAPPVPPPAPEPVPAVDVTAESLGTFANKVQPILMNACISCHTAGRGGSFQLTRSTGAGLANRRSVDKNLTAVLGQVNTKEPVLSRFLLKAVSVHAPGMAQAPLRGRDAAAFRTLEQWVARTVESNPQLREDVQASATKDVARKPEAAGFGEDRSPKPVASAPPAAVATPKPAGPADPVDPDGFNREFHPQRPAEAKKDGEKK